MRRQRVFKAVKHGDEPFDHPRLRPVEVFSPLLFDSFAVVLEIRLSADQRLPQFLEVGGQPRNLGVGPGGIGLQFLRFRSRIFVPVQFFSVALLVQVPLGVLLLRGEMSPFKDALKSC